LRLEDSTEKEKILAMEVVESFQKTKVTNLGPKFKQIKDLKELSSTPEYFGLEIIDTEDPLTKSTVEEQEDIKKLKKRYDISIDNKKVEDFESYFRYYEIPVLHRHRLTPGLHQLRLENLLIPKIVFDGDIIFDGIDPVEIIIGKCDKKHEDCHVKMQIANKIEFDNSHFQEGSLVNAEG